MPVETTSADYCDSDEGQAGAFRRNIFAKRSSWLASQADEEDTEDTSSIHSAWGTIPSHSAERLALTSIEDYPISGDTQYRVIRDRVRGISAMASAFTISDLLPFVGEAAWQGVDRESLTRSIEDLLRDWRTRPSLGLAWSANVNDQSPDPLRQYFADAAEDEAKRRAPQHEIDTRLADLKSEASDESIQISEASERGLRRFLRHYRPRRRPAIALLENGRLRIQWRRGNGEQVSLQFRGYDEIQFVFFVRRADILASSAGRDNFEGIKARLKADGLLDLVAG